MKTTFEQNFPVFAAVHDFIENPTEWLDIENPAFDGRTPRDLINNGKHDRIWNMIYQLETGTL